MTTQIPTNPQFRIATGGYKQVPDGWMAATRVRPFIFDDPVLIWLEFHGAKHGFVKDEPTPYDFGAFIFEKGHEFERKWIKEKASGAKRVCQAEYDVRSVDKLRETLDLMEAGVPLIAAPALWWAPEKVYGVPDLLVHTLLLREHFPEIHLAQSVPDHYVVFDMKFTTRLDSTAKKLALANYGAQVRIYSYILGQLQGVMPQHAFLVCRDRISNPLGVQTFSKVGSPLDKDLQMIRDQNLDIKNNGHKYLPWTHKIVEVNLSNDEDDPWHLAKIEIARNKVPGGDPCLLYQIGRKQKEDLANHGFPTLDSLLKSQIDDVPFERCYNLGAAKSRHIRAVLRANKENQVTPPVISRIPPVKANEFYVDFETFNNLNVDFDKQWPTLDGCPMIFMIGVGWEENGEWKFTTFIAPEETSSGEMSMLDDFITFLRKRAEETLLDPKSTVLYHWTNAEVSEIKRAADRQTLRPDHPVRRMPWYDLEKEIFLAEPIGIPLVWKYQLKGIATSLSLVNWPGELDQGLRASVAGWKAYAAAKPLEAPEMKIVAEYNEVDCRALWKILKWVRSKGRPNNS